MYRWIFASAIPAFLMSLAFLCPAISAQEARRGEVQAAPLAQTAGVSSKSTLDSRVDVMLKKTAGATYLFAVNMFNQPESPIISLPGIADAKAEVLGENRQVDVKAGQLRDPFAPYAVHLYKIQ